MSVLNACEALCSARRRVRWVGERKGMLSTNKGAYGGEREVADKPHRHHEAKDYILLLLYDT